MNDTQWLMLSGRLDRLEEKLDVGLEKISSVKTEMEVLKVKAGIWGSISGSVVFVISFFLQKALK